MEIDQQVESGYESVRIDGVGYADPLAVEGALLLKSYDGRELQMRAFSGEVATHISSFVSDSQDEVPTIYRMVAEICEINDLLPVKVKVYNSESILRANIYLTGKKDVVLRNYRASDALALAALYKIPILVRNDLLKDAQAAS